jgi:hypothetical protein
MNAALPADVLAAIEESQAKVEQRMAGFAQYVAAKRDEAVKYRQELGIEAIWTECEERYLGIDDLNRHEWEGQAWSSWIKSPSPNGPLRQRGGGDDEGRATAYPRITARYVDAGAAKVGDIMIPVDGKTFGFKRTPVPDLIAGMKDTSPVVVEGQPMTRPARPGDPAGPDGQPPAEVPLTVKDLAENVARLADEAAEAASDQIHDWMVECRHSRTLRKAIFDGARLGTMVIKGPVPTRRKGIAVKTEGGIRVESVTTLVPQTAWVNPWNLYPAPDCGEDATSGSYMVEKDAISYRTLQALKDQDGYIASSIDRVLKEGPDKCMTTDYVSKGSKPTQFTIWYFWGCIQPDELALCNPNLYAKHKADLSDEVYAIVTMVNDTPIKVALNPLKSGRFPHKVAVWRRRAGCWAGQGVSEQMKSPQAIITGATRAMLNNGGKSAGSQVVMDNEIIVPADQVRRITPDKLWHKAPEATMDDVRKAFAVFTIPNVTPQLLTIIEYGFKLAEESTSIPLITQGQSGDTTPDTFGGQQLQDNNANQLLRDIGMSVAEDLTEPLVQDFYEWLLLDPNVPDSCKGDFQVDVSGSIALIEKALQDQTIAQMGALVGNPAFGLDPELWAVEFLRSKRLNPVNFQLSQEKKDAMANQPPPEAPQVTAAKIRAEAQVATAQSRDELLAEKVRVDTDRDTKFVESQERRDAATYNARMEELKLQRELADLKYRQALVDYANRKDIALDAAKTELSKVAMTLSVQKEMAGMNGGKAEEVAEPIVEPAGRAEDGRAFQE